MRCRPVLGEEMSIFPRSAARLRTTAWRVLACAACALALVCVAQVRAAGADQAVQPGAAVTPPPDVSAALEQCVTAVEQSERSATFSGEMTAVPGTERMLMRIDLLERLRGEAVFHAVSAPGLGVWRVSEKKVKVYKSLQQVTNLSAPATYRALVIVRWLNARGHVIKRDERLTPKCEQPAPPPPVLPVTEPSTPPSTPTTPASP